MTTDRHELRRLTDGRPTAPRAATTRFVNEAERRSLVALRGRAARFGGLTGS